MWHRQRRVDALRAQLGINDPPGSVEITSASGEHAPAPLMTAETLRKLETLRIESRAEYLRQAALLERLKSVQKERGPEGLAQAISTAAPDTLLTALQGRLDTAEQKLVSLKKEYGPTNPEVVKTEAGAEVLRRKIRERVDGIMLGLETRLLSLTNGLEHLSKEVENATQRDIERASRSQPYFEAKANLDELKRFRQILETKIATEKVDLALPKTTLVEIVDKATPAPRPVSPNLPRALALIGLGVLMDVGGLFLLTGRSSTLSEPQPA